MLLTLTNCPVCKSAAIHEVLKAVDHTVSKESFVVFECKDCTHRFTNPVPDSNSIGPYYKSEAYVSHTNTNKGLVNRAYQIVRKWTLKRKLRMIVGETSKASGNLLDIGSGAGAFLATMKNANWNAIGLEPDPDAREVALRDFAVESLPIEELQKLEPAQFDAITMWHVLEHVHDLDGYMKKLHELMKPDARLLIAVPNYTSWDARKYGSAWAAYDVPRHLYHFSPQSMHKLLELNGFKLLKMKRMPFDSFYVSMLTERHKKGNLVFALWNGFCSYCAAVFDRKQCSSIIYVIRK